MRRWQKINRLPKKTALTVLVLVVLGLGAWFWPRGLDLRDGRHDRSANGILLDPAWIADDAYFASVPDSKQKERVRDPIVLAEFARTLREHHVTDLVVQLPAPKADGSLSGVEGARLEAVLYECYDARGWAQIHAPTLPCSDSRWRRFFVLDLRRLLNRHPRLQGCSFISRTLQMAMRIFSRCSMKPSPFALQTAGS